jgi:hypothetical protein
MFNFVSQNYGMATDATFTDNPYSTGRIAFAEKVLMQHQSEISLKKPKLILQWFPIIWI